ncbi:putative polyketide biosynthesis zinc-dependent hydrolase BaeB, partial [Haemophilus influenzae]
LFCLIVGLIKRAKF